MDGRLVGVLSATACLTVGCLGPAEEAARDPGSSVSASLTAATDTSVEFDAAIEDLMHARAESVRGSTPPEALPLQFRAGGGVRSMLGPGFRVGPAALGIDATANPRTVADAFVHRFAPLWQVGANEFDSANVRIEHHSSPLGADADRVVYSQVHAGREVVGAELAVVVDSRTREILAVLGSFVHLGPEVDAAPAPAIDTRGATAAAGGGEARALVYWSGLANDTSSPPRLAWNVVGTDPDGAREDVYVDSLDGSVLGRARHARESLHRALTDTRIQCGYDSRTCERWSNVSYPWPACVAPCTRAACVACATDQQQCSHCTCRDEGVPDPAGCETSIWHYDEASGGCVANGDPPGEVDCSAGDGLSLSLWNNAGTAYNYWQTTFGRDSWNGTGGWLMLRSHVATGSDCAGGVPWAGLTEPMHVGTSGGTVFPFVQVSIGNGGTSAWLHGHELGHALQYGTYGFNGLSGFYGQTIDVLESHADLHGFRYQAMPMGYDCSA